MVQLRNAFPSSAAVTFLLGEFTPNLSLIHSEKTSLNQSAAPVRLALLPFRGECNALSSSVSRDRGSLVRAEGSSLSLELGLKTGVADRGFV